MTKYVALLAAWGANLPIACLYGGIGAAFLFSSVDCALMLVFTAYDVWQYMVEEYS